MKTHSTRINRKRAHLKRPGVIRQGELYTLDEAKFRLAMTDSAMRAARRRGLVLLQCGKRRYVTGAEILRFLEASGQQPEA